MNRRSSLALFVATGLALHLGNASHAEACGGCFHPPEGLVSSVNAHRMAFAMSPRGSTLWDQIVYTGAPRDFVWVLPIAGEARVEVADNGFFEALTEGTQILMEAPPAPRTFCGDPCPSTGLLASSARSPTGESSFDSDVMVFHEGVVGPYETATIGSEDPRALVAWLMEHGYGVDDSILPTIDHYVRLNMNFAVLRLRPGAGIDRMQPVRVTVPGLSTSLPLRMVQAGVVIEVDLELFVFAESRIEASNFGNAVVDRGLVTFDWSTRLFDYETAFDAALFSGEGPRTNWVTEYAQPIGPNGNGASGGRGGGIVEARVGWSRLQSFASFGSDGEPHRSAEDAAVVRAAFGESDVYLTRLRTRLQRTQLQEDLALRMSGGGNIGTHILITNELNRQPDAVCSDFCASGNGLEPGGSHVRGGGAMRRCSVSMGSSGEGVSALLGLGVVAMLFSRRRVR